MASSSLRTRRFSFQSSPPPSPTMQALRIGSLHRSPGSDGAYTRPPHPAYVAGKPVAANTDYLDLDDDDLEDDFEPEPALTSDDATAPSSSRAPSPSVSPVDESAFVAVVSSSPQRETFLRSYVRSGAPITKPDPCDEDVAAVLLSLALPRVGRLPSTPVLPQHPPSGPKSTPPQTASIVVADALASHHEIVPDASRQSMPSKTATVEDHLSKPALIDVPSPVLPVEDVRRSPSPLVQSDEAQQELVQEDVVSPALLSSPLPPSSPLPEDEDENATDVEVNEEADGDGQDVRPSPSRMSSPLSCLSSVLPSPKMPLETLDFDLDVPDLSARDSSPSPEPVVMSPLSSPPTSRASSLAPVPVDHALLSRQTQSEEDDETQDDHLAPSKRKSSLPPPASPPRRKRARRIIPESSPEPDSEAEAAIEVESAVDGEHDAHMREPTPEPAPRRKRAKAASTGKKAARTSGVANGKTEKASDIASVDDRTNESCPHPALPSLVVEAFALSRATSLSSIALYDVICTSYPAMAASAASSTRASSTTKSDSPALSQQNVEEVLLWGAARGIFELLPSSGDGLPPTFFYLPAADWDKERAGLHAALGGRVARAGRRAYKQYYWKPVVLPRGSSGRSSRRRGGEEEVQRGWEVDWEE